MPQVLFHLQYLLKCAFCFKPLTKLQNDLTAVDGLFLLAIYLHANLQSIPERNYGF